KALPAGGGATRLGAQLAKTKSKVKSKAVQRAIESLDLISPLLGFTPLPGVNSFEYRMFGLLVQGKASLRLKGD
ncbi:MAG: hypothetical protein P8075_19280, partial [Deltaproteobacteria bacterium]